MELQNSIIVVKMAVTMKGTKSRRLSTHSPMKSNTMDTICIEEEKMMSIVKLNLTEKNFKSRK